MNEVWEVGERSKIAWFSTGRRRYIFDLCFGDTRRHVWTSKGYGEAPLTSVFDDNVSLGLAGRWATRGNPAHRD